MKKSSTPEALARDLEEDYILGRSISPNFQSESSDIFIATFPKCGTTLIQQIVYGLISHGDMSFEEIGDISPYLDFYNRKQEDAGEFAGSTPRLFKTHLYYEDLHEQGRYICCFRNPGDAALSYYHFLADWFFDKETISPDAYVQQVYTHPDTHENFWRYLLSWYPALDNPNTLAVCYEDLVPEKLIYINRICNFLGFDCTPEHLSLIEHQSSFEFMKKNEEKFDEKHLRIKCRFLKPGDTTSLTSKVRSGKQGGHKEELSEESIALLERQWQEIITPVLGFKNYDEFRANVIQRSKTHCNG